MSWVVCKNKDDGKLFIVTRQARETMINVMLDLGQPPDSNVQREFKDYSDALKYKNDIENSDDQIDKIINE